MEKAMRRRQVPAFGEWNYCYHPYDAPPAAECYYAPECYVPESEACSDVWFRYSPLPRKQQTPRKKTRRPEGDAARGEKGSGRRVRASEADGLARASAIRGRSGASASRVVRPVDEDLYQVPPPELIAHRPRRKRRSLLMGCLGLNSCVA